MCKCWDSALHLAAGNIEILQTLQKYRTLYNVDTDSLNFKCSQNYNLVNNSTINGLYHVSGMVTINYKLRTQHPLLRLTILFMFKFQYSFLGKIYSFNNRWRILMSGFGHMLSVGAIGFEDRFCISRKCGTGKWDRGRWVGTLLCLTVHDGSCSFL